MTDRPLAFIPTSTGGFNYREVLEYDLRADGALLVKFKYCASRLYDDPAEAARIKALLDHYVVPVNRETFRGAR